MDEERVLYHFEIPYPWKKFLRGLVWITIFMGFVGLLLMAYPFFITHKLTSVYWFIGGTIGIFIILFALYVIMRYVLIHGDKIKTPIKVWATPYEVHFRKGNIKKDFSIEYLKTARVALTDKIVMLETNYEKDEDWKKGWKVAFKRNNELQDTDYREFINETFLPFTEIVIDRLKEINPDIRITRTDERRKYR